MQKKLVQSELIDTLEVSTRMRHALLTSLFYAADKVANTVGHYDAFRRGSEVSKSVVLKVPNLKTGQQNYVFNLDSNELVRNISNKRILLHILTLHIIQGNTQTHTIYLRI